MKTIHCGGMVGGVPNQYLDVREIPWHEWQPLPDYTAPCDQNGFLNDPDQLKPSAAIFEDGLTGNAQHIDAFALDYPPYQGDMIRVGTRDSTGGPGMNRGALNWIGCPWSRSTIVLVYHNDIPVPFLHDWDVPAHVLKLKLSYGDRDILIPRLLIPPLARRVLWVMSNNTVIGADSIMEPQTGVNGLDAFPLRVDTGLGIWCPPRKFKYHAGGAHWETVAPSWWFQHEVNSICASRVSLERNLVTGIVGKDASLVVLLNYNRPTQDEFVLALDARAQKYEGADPIATFTRLEAIADPFCTPIGTGPTAAAKVKPPAGGNKPFTVGFILPASLMGSEPPPELEFRLMRLGEDAADTAQEVDFLGGAVLAWFESPYLGGGL